MALQDLSLAGSSDSALPTTPQQQPSAPSSTQPTSTPQFALPSAPVNPYIAQQQAAANDMNAAQAQIAAQQAPTYTPPTLSGQPTFFAKLLQGALNGLAGGLAQGQQNIAGAGTPGFIPGGNGLSYAERLQQQQDQRQAEADKAKQDTAQQQFENDKATYQLKQLQTFQQVQSAKNKMAVLDHLQSLEHADQEARDKQQASMDAQLKEAQDAGAKVTDIKVQPGQNPKDVFASFLQANPGWMADPNHNATVTYDSDGDISSIHAFVDDSKRRLPVSEVNKRLAAIPGSTLQYDEGDNPDQPHTMTVHDMNSVMASEHTTSAQRLYDAKKEKDKADQQMALARFNQSQENYRHNTPAGGASSIENDSLANSTPDSNGVRQQYLQSLPADVQAQIKAIGEGRMAAPNNRTKIGKELADQVATAYPNYDASKQPAYQKMRNDFVAGKSAQGLNALNTAIEHLGVMADNASITSTLPGLSAIERGLGNQQANNFKTAQSAASDEVGKAYKGGVLSQHEAEEWQSQIGGWTPASAKAKATSLVGLLKGKIDSYQQQLDNGTPSGVPSGLRLTNDASQRTYDRLLGSQSNQSQQSGSVSVKAPNGKTYSFKDQQSADLFKKNAGIQ